MADPQTCMGDGVQSQRNHYIRREFQRQTETCSWSFVLGCTENVSEKQREEKAERRRGKGHRAEGESRASTTGEEGGRAHSFAGRAAQTNPTPLPAFAKHVTSIFPSGQP